MDDRREERKARIAEGVTQRKYSAAVERVAEELTELLGLPVGRSDAVAKEAVQSALDAASNQDEVHLVWHRIWGVRLLPEVVATMTRLGGHFKNEDALIVWGNQPMAGFLLPVEAALCSLPKHIGPEAGSVGPGGTSDLLLVADDGDAGLRLEYNHLSGSDEYVLRCWGRYAFSLE